MEEEIPYKNEGGDSGYECKNSPIHKTLINTTIKT